MKEQNLKDKIIIYPTDTIYGIGCYALNSELVKKIKEIKKRENKPFSIIVNKTWIRDNCEVNKLVEEYLRKLPGKYTFILELKNKNAVSKEVNNNGETIGVRIPKHEITKILPIPFVTTSVNLSGEKPITNIKDIPEEIRNRVDLIMDYGTLKNQASTVIDLTGDKAVVLRR